MSLTHTALHGAAGEPGSQPLSFAIIRAAVDAKAAEDETLEWKQALPTRAEKHTARNELQQDAAAMANLNGGVLVYGVAETSGSRAGEIVGVLDAHPDNIIAQALQGVQPMIPGVVVESFSEDGLTLVVVRVPASALAPHAIVDAGAETLKFPVRNGASTRFLREHELERMYRRRFDVLNSFDQRLGQLEHEVSPWLSSANEHSPWFVGVGTPVTPRRGKLRKGDFDAVVADTAGLAEALAGGNVGGVRDSPLASLLDDSHVALSSWVGETLEYSPRVPAADRVASHAYLRVFDDGAFAYALRFDALALCENPDDRPPDGHGAVAADLLQRCPAELLALADRVAENLDVPGPWLLRLGLHGVQNTRISLVRKDRFLRQFERYPGARSTPRFLPLAAQVDLPADSEILREVSIDLVTQAYSQFAVRWPASRH